MTVIKITLIESDTVGHKALQICKIIGNHKTQNISFKMHFKSSQSCILPNTVVFKRDLKLMKHTNTVCG